MKRSYVRTYGPRKRFRGPRGWKRPVRRVLRRRRRYRPRYQRSRAQYSKFKKTYLRSAPQLRRGYAGNIVRHTYIPGQIRTLPMYKNVLRAIGESHYSQWHATGVSSVGALTHQLCYRFMPSFDNDTNYSFKSAQGGWLTIGLWGHNYVAGGVPTGMKRILWGWTRIRVVVRRVSEDATFRMQICRCKKGSHRTGAFMNNYEWNVNAPQTNQYWEVLHERKRRFENTESPTASVEYNMYFPWNRVIETYDKVDATNITSWHGNSQENDFLCLTLTSNDVTDIDTEVLTYELFVQHHWFALF